MRKEKVAPVFRGRNYVNTLWIITEILFKEKTAWLWFLTENDQSWRAAAVIPPRR